MFFAGSEGDLQTAKDFLSVLQTELGIDTGAESFFEAGSAASQHATNSIPKTKKPKAWSTRVLFNRCIRYLISWIAVDVYYPVMNTPLDRALEVFDEDGEVLWSAKLEEVADDTDPEAGKYFDAVPTFHGLSFDGDVKGELVYANYGRKEVCFSLLVIPVAHALTGLRRPC
jgi:N-acetylated-alpha-linked acidic dipeptidase